MEKCRSLFIAFLGVFTLFSCRGSNPVTSESVSFSGVVSSVAGASTAATSLAPSESSAIERAEFSKTLKHVTYWDKFDAWDFRTVHVDVYRFDGTSFAVALDDPSVSYSVTPDAPAKGVTTVSLIDGAYKASDGKTFLIPDAVYYVAIEPYPHLYSVTDFIILGVSLTGFTLSIVGFIVLVFKREKIVAAWKKRRSSRNGD